MARVASALAVVLAGLATAVGCRPAASPPVTIASPNAAALEARIAKLEADFHAVAAARDAARAERDAVAQARDIALAAAADFETRWQAERANAATLTAARDALTASLRRRTAEHESTTARLDALKSGLRTLLAGLDGPTPSSVGAVASPAAAVPLSAFHIGR